MLPNFLIVGPPKSGTTSLQLYLSRHPDIFVKGETHFFDRKYNKGLEWYEELFKERENEKAVGEKTPAYFYEKDIPSKIKKDLPDVKLLFIFRDPIKRAHSHYWHNVRHASEKSKTFEEAIEKKDSEYLEISKYITYLKKWNKYFPKSKLFFMTVENLNQDVLRDALGFLDVDTNFKFGELKKYNVGGAVRSTRLAKISQNNLVKKIPYLSEFIKRGLNMKRGKTPEINEGTKKKLKKYFKKYNKGLSEFTGLDLNCWDE